MAAVQPPYNMLQRDIEADTLPWCREHGVGAMVYWPLLKGLLAGKLPRDHVFPPTDSRLQISDVPGRGMGEEPGLARSTCGQSPPRRGKSVSQVVINWTIHQPGITVALCGAKRPDQIRENAARKRLAADARPASAHRHRARQARPRCDETAGVIGIVSSYFITSRGERNGSRQLLLAFCGSLIPLPIAAKLRVRRAG